MAVQLFLGAILVAVHPTDAQGGTDDGALPALDNSKCPTDFEDVIQDSQFCYTVSQVKKNFEDASQSCKLMGGSLIQVNHPLENKEIAVIIAKMPIGDQKLWLGLKKSDDGMIVQSKPYKMLAANLQPPWSSRPKHF